MKKTRVVKERIEKNIKDISGFGIDPDGGVTRLPFSKAQKDANDYIIGEFEKAGLSVQVDGIGNIFAKREGIDNSLPSIIIGSHLDTVINGGNFDGILGVVSGLEVIRALNDHNIVTKNPIEIASFFMEESSSFGKSCVGSRAFIGELDYDELSDVTNKEGLSLKDAFTNNGITKKDIISAKRDPKTIESYLELHIEQADVLINANKPVGIVTNIAAATKIKVSIQGVAAHSGAAPMKGRKDALCAAAELILGVERIASKEAGSDTVGTVGTLNVKPGSVNIVPGGVELQIDLRDIEQKSKDKALDLIKDLIEDIKDRRGVEIEYKYNSHDNPLPTSKIIQDIQKNAAKKLEIPTILMPSKAAHDAYILANITDIGMIFVRSYQGSHNPNEWADFEDIALSVELLLETVLNI